VRPGAMMRRYVAGHRKQYANPFTYLLVALAVSLAGQHLTGFRETMVAEMETTAGATPAQVLFIQQVTELFLRNMLYISIGMLVPFAFFLRWFFKKTGFNLAECLVFALFTGGHTTLLTVVLQLVPYRLILHTVASPVIALLYLSFAARGFFAESSLKVLSKVTVAYVVSYAFLNGAMLAVTLFYIFQVQPSFLTGEQWNLVTAAEAGMDGVVEELMAAGADVNMTRHETALHVAARAGDDEIVDLLLARGADPNRPDYLGRVPMCLALEGEHFGLARRLAEAGTDASAVTSDGASLLWLALRKGQLDLARWAVANGADVNAVRNHGRRASALMVAAGDDNLEWVELLLAHGADPTLTNDEGETALDLASDEVAELLRAASGRPGPAVDG